MSGYYGSSYGYGEAMGAGSIIMLIMFLGVGILMLVAQWRLFTKADEGGWKCLIPVYNVYTWFKITWDTSVFWKIFGGSIAFSVLSMIITAISSSSRSGLGVGAAITGILGLAYAVILIVVGIKELIYTARSYGKNGSFAVGLFFLTFIFYPILAFGDSQYVGPKGIPYGADSRSYTDDPNAPTDKAIGYYSGTAAPAVNKANLIWIIVGVCALLLCVGLIPRFMMAMTNYNPYRGLFGSPWVGFQNFQRMFMTPAFSSSLLNSVIFGAVTLIVSFLFSLLGGAVGASGSRMARAVLAAVGAVIAFIPTAAYERLVLPHLTAGAGFNLLIPLVHALPVGGIAMMLGALLQRVWPQNRFSAVLIAPLLTLTSFFFDRAYISTLLRNLLNRNYTETIVSFSIDNTFGRGKYSLGAAAELFQSVINLIPALVGALMIGMLLKKAQSSQEPSSQGISRGSILGGVLALACMLIAGIALIFGYPDVFQQPSVSSALVSSIIAALLTCLLAFGVYFAVLLCAGKFDAQRWLPFALLVLLTVQFNRISIADYINAHNLSLLNTMIMPVLCGVVNPLSVMLILGAVILRPRRTSTCLMFALGAALLSAAYVTGDVSSYYIYTTNRGIQNLGLLIRNTAFQASSVISETADPQAAANIGSSLVGVILVTAAVPVGLGAALFVNAAQRDS